MRRPVMTDTPTPLTAESEEFVGWLMREDNDFSWPKCRSRLAAIEAKAEERAVERCLAAVKALEGSTPGLTVDPEVGDASFGMWWNRSTDESRALLELEAAARREGYSEGYEQGRALARMNAEEETRRLREALVEPVSEAIYRALKLGPATAYPGLEAIAAARAALAAPAASPEEE
jgi:hypothetical protein